MTPADPSPQDLIAGCQGLVRSLAAQVHRKFSSQFDLDDLIAYGQVGLAEAAREFQADRGTQFSTYAYYRIRGAVYDGISKMSGARRTQSQRVRFQQVAGDVLAETADAKPGDNLEEDGSWLLNLTKKLTVAYLTTGLSDEIIDATADPAAALPSDIVAQRELHERLNSLIGSLPDEERSLIRAAYFEGLTLQDAAARLGISKSWASRLHSKTLQRLASALRQVGLSD